MKNMRLYNGVEIPVIGFGTYKATNADEGYKIVSEAIEAGYRHLDTAALYNNEEDVGRAVRESGIAREKFFITSKLNRNKLGYENTKREFEISCEKLGTDYLDLYLIHWPRPDYGSHDFENWRQLDKESWRAMEELYIQGRIHAIGLSNFHKQHIENIMETAKVLPMVNQLELHPGYIQEEAVEYSRLNSIAIEAWSPIGRARLSENKTLKKIADKYQISVAQLCLAFDLAMGYIILPKSTHKERMVQNLNADKIVLRDEDIEEIMGMPQAGWSGEHPDRERVPAEIS